jgi:AcrR family transcriptional regulator
VSNEIRIAVLPRIGSLGDTIGPGSPHLATESLSARLRAKRSEMMLSELEAVALRLFVERGFGDVTIEEIAAQAHISVRTFYRYFPTKDDVLQLRIERRSEALRAALSARPPDEPPLHSLRLALAEVTSSEDTAVVKRWITVIRDTPSVLRAVVGGIQLKRQRMIAEFFASRLGLPGDALVPTMLAAAAEGVIQAAQTQWFIEGGHADLASTLSEGLAVLERAIGSEPGISYRIKAAGD